MGLQACASGARGFGLVVVAGGRQPAAVLPELLHQVPAGHQRDQLDAGACSTTRRRSSSTRSTRSSVGLQACASGARGFGVVVVAGGRRSAAVLAELLHQVRPGQRIDQLDAVARSATRGSSSTRSTRSSTGLQAGASSA